MEGFRATKTTTMTKKNEFLFCFSVFVSLSLLTHSNLYFSLSLYSTIHLLLCACLLCFFLRSPNDEKKNEKENHALCYF